MQARVDGVPGGIDGAEQVGKVQRTGATGPRRVEASV